MRKDDMDLVHRYLDGELGREEASAFEQRVLAEEDLKKYFDEMKALEASVNALDVFKAPDIGPFRRIGMPYLNTRSSLRPFLAGAVVAAACVLVGIVVGVKALKTPAMSRAEETFRIVYYAPDANSVSVLGDFNGWTMEIPLKPRGEEGYWLAEIQVKPGEYRYVLKIDGKERPDDPLADYIIDDDFGSKNSVVRIGL